VGLVFSQQHRTMGQVADVLVEVGQDLVAVGVAFGDQTGPPPCCDLTDTPVQGPQAHGGATQLLPQPADGPGLGLAEQPADPLAEPGAAQPWPAAAGPVGQGGSAVVLVAVDPAAHGRGIVAQQVGDLGRCEALLGEQDHHQATADSVGAVQQTHQVAGVGGWAGGVGVHAGGTHTSGGLVWLFGVWKLQRPARLPHRWSARSQPRVTSETSGQLLSTTTPVDDLRGLGRAAWVLSQPAPPMGCGRGGLAPLLPLPPRDRHRRAPRHPWQHHPQQLTDLRDARLDLLAVFPTCAARTSQTPRRAAPG
jgi:hypothetical protein